MRIEAVPGLEANVCCDGVRLQEYEGGEAETPLEAVRFIEATSGSKFTVTLQIDSDRMKSILEDHIHCEVKLDGKYACSWLYDVKYTYVHHIQGRSARVDGQSVLQKFVFADLITNDGPAGSTQTEDVKHIGEIHVLLRFVRIISSRAEDDSPIAADTKDSLSEKCLKGKSVSNRVAYGKPEPTARTNVAITEYPHGMDPFAKFVFKYRSRKDLQIEDIIPRSPSPVPLEERDPDDLSPEEARELIRRLRTQGGETAVKIKKEKRGRPVEDDTDDDDDDDVEVTEQRAAKRTRLSTDSGVELIDLTDD